MLKVLAILAVFAVIAISADYICSLIKKRNNLPDTSVNVQDGVEPYEYARWD
jgi:hypothetical protein